MYSYLNPEVIEKLNKLVKLLQWEKSIENHGELYDFIVSNKLDNISKTYSEEFTSMKDEAKKDKAESITDSWCFSIDYNEITFYTDKVIDFLVDNINGNDYTLFDVLKNSDISGLSYDWEYDNINDDATLLNNAISDVIDEYIEEYINSPKYKIRLIVLKKLKQLGFNSIDNNYFYENTKVSIEIKDIYVPEIDNEYEYSYDDLEDEANNVKLNICLIDKTINRKQEGNILFSSITKYTQPLLV